MNRLILIGNGFDLAHLYRTSYVDFINSYWENVNKTLQKEGKYFSPEIIIEKRWTTLDGNYLDISKFKSLANSLKKSNGEIIFKNKFLEHISTTHDLKNWVDIENEYYNELVKTIVKKEVEAVLKLNEDFQNIINLFKEYLEKSYSNGFLRDFPKNTQGEFYQSMLKIFFEKVNKNEINTSCDFELNINNILVVNFNYTYTDKIYFENSDQSKLIENIEVLRIHGELDDKANNKIIFGFGDELDENYKTIESLNDNRYFEYIKSFKYLENNNYSKLLKFIESDNFQVVIVGHSCGVSDRTLLNTIFENKNCISIKPYYYQGKNQDNYSDIVKNISRCFNDKIEMRSKVVNKSYCRPICNFS